MRRTWQEEEAVRPKTNLHLHAGLGDKRAAVNVRGQVLEVSDGLEECRSKNLPLQKRCFDSVSETLGGMCLPLARIAVVTDSPVRSCQCTASTSAPSYWRRR